MKIKEVILGVSLSTGFLTSYRFLGPVGISEIFFLLFFILLAKEHGKSVIKSISPREENIKIILMITFLFILPIMTFISFYSDVEKSEPIYLLSYILGGGILIILPKAIDDGFDMKLVTLVFAIFFIGLNLLFIKIGIGTEGYRYTGGANNPNQLLFYGGSLSLLIVVYFNLLQLLFLPILLYIMLKTGSDAYSLSLFSSLVVFVLGRIITFGNVRFKLAISFYAPLIFITLLIFIFNNLELIADIWSSGDEGGARLTLFYNSILAGSQSPLFGFGAGSFSGISYSFDGKEAHNTFLDLLNQFGLFLPLFLYAIMFIYIINNLKSKRCWIAGFAFAYMSSSFFHFSGRHFVFWVEMAIFYHSAFYLSDKNTKVKNY